MLINKSQKYHSLEAIWCLLHFREQANVCRKILAEKYNSLIIKKQNTVPVQPSNFRLKQNGQITRTKRGINNQRESEGRKARKERRRKEGDEKRLPAILLLTRILEQGQTRPKEEDRESTDKNRHNELEQKTRFLRGVMSLFVETAENRASKNDTHHFYTH